jgi:hypothetical protein
MSLLLAAVNPLERLLSQPQLLVVIFAGVVWLLKFLGRAKAAATQASNAPRPARPQESDAAEAAARRAMEDEERAQRVREDIQRRIAERQARAEGGLRPASVRPERVSPPPLVPARMFREAEPVIPSAAFPPVETRAPAMVPGRPPAAAAAVGAGPLGPPPGVLWLDELRSPETARRAILLREILGPPIALR